MQISPVVPYYRLTSSNLPRFQGGVLRCSNVAQMALANVPNKVFAFELSVTTLPPATDQGVCCQFPNMMHVPEMFRNTLACNLGTASLRATVNGTLT